MKNRALTQRLAAYRESARGAGTPKKGPGWAAFAAATGSALAMASSASANTIVFGTNGGSVANLLGQHATIQSVGPAGDAMELDIARALRSFKTKTKTKTKTHTTTFGLGAGPGHGNFSTTATVSSKHVHTHTHIHTHTKIVERSVTGLAVLIQGGNGGIVNPNVLGNITAGKFPGPNLFKTVGVGNFYAGAEWLVGANKDLGWVKLDWTGSQWQLLEWAYNSVPSQSITVGQTSNSSVPAAPEPSTMALGLLAAGAAGVLAWRRRRGALPHGGQ